MPSLGEEASAMRMALVAKDRTLCLIILAGVVSEDCAAFFQLPVVGEERAFVMSRKDSLTNAGWPSQPRRGRSRHRPHQSYGPFCRASQPNYLVEPPGGNELDTPNAKATIPNIVTLLLSLVFMTYAMVFRHNGNGHFRYQ